MLLAVTPKIPGQTVQCAAVFHGLCNKCAVPHRFSKDLALIERLIRSLSSKAAVPGVGVDAGRPLLSFIVIVYDMQREVVRTIQTLARDYQRGAEGIDYEIVVVDNGSPTPLDLSRVGEIGVPLRLIYRENATSSPADAINEGVANAAGDYVAVMIDGARMLSPGVVRGAADAVKLAEQPVVAVLGLHLGPAHQRTSIEQGYSKDVEDALLAEVNWRHNGYGLFGVSSWGGSCAEGWFGPAAESNCIVVSKDFFDALGGYDEAFRMPGGGLVNLDFYRRSVEHPDSKLIYLLGEGCFHQLHGGVTTGKSGAGHSFEELNEEYRQIRGEGFQAPEKQPLLYGTLGAPHGAAMARAVNQLNTAHANVSVDEACAPFLAAEHRNDADNEGGPV